MPVYEYRCLDCGTITEKLVLGPDEEVRCIKCGRTNLERILSATADFQNSQSQPGPGDTTCCGSSPGQAANCAGPGSCCGRAME
ncbi:MAG: zinc ribbon domain-containing protein [Deltaproteobacteria bacterium]|nr:zinc ribbon domain-containing protein [Deltaproteobacteria bacterium]